MESTGRGISGGVKRARAKFERRTMGRDIVRKPVRGGGAKKIKKTKRQGELSESLSNLKTSRCYYLFKKSMIVYPKHRSLSLCRVYYFRWSKNKPFSLVAL